MRGRAIAKFADVLQRQHAKIRASTRRCADKPEQEARRKAFAVIARTGRLSLS